MKENRQEEFQEDQNTMGVQEKRSPSFSTKKNRKVLLCTKE
jgi:hypothetical protein